MSYTIHMGVQFDFLTLIDVPKLIESCTDKWYNQTLCRVNDSIVRLGVFNEGTFHWHKHDEEDEFFFVLQGELYIDIEKETIVLKKHQGITIPKGVLHRPFVKEPTAVIMVEKDTVVPAGDA